MIGRARGGLTETADPSSFTHLHLARTLLPLLLLACGSSTDDARDAQAIDVALDADIGPPESDVPDAHLDPNDDVGGGPADTDDNDLEDVSLDTSDVAIEPEDAEDESRTDTLPVDTLDALDSDVMADTDTDVMDTVPSSGCTSDLMCERLQACAGESCVDRAGETCDSHSVCGRAGACDGSTCVDRRTMRGTVRLTPVPTILADHFVGSPGRREPFGNGRGGAVLDFDGDGQLDLFVGGIPEVGSESCLFRNTSDGEVSFEMTELCGTLGRVDGAAATDLNMDGVHELTTFGIGAVNHWSWDGGTWTQADLYPLITEAGLGCSAGGGTVMDADRDGDLDLLVHCQHDPSAVPIGYANVVLEAEDGAFIGAWSQERAGFLADDGLTLAVHVSDLNEDGLTDIITLDDTFSANGAVNTSWEPGGIIWGCAPIDECEWRRTRLGVGPRAWGSFMGAASLRLFDGEELVYLSDLGLDRLVNVATGDAPDDEASDRGVAEFPRDDSVFTWGAFTEDLDQNGLDDLFVVTGDAIPPRIAGGDDTQHIDRHVMQTSEGLELVFRPEFSPESDPVFPGRFCAAVDFNGDGRLEFATTPFIGAVRLESEATPEWGGVRSALVPTSRVVHQLGARFEVWSETGWQRRATHGQPRSTSSPYLTVPEGPVRVRFPSGAVLNTFVEGPGPHALEEPDWLTIERGLGEVEVRIVAEHWADPVEGVSVAHRTEHGTELVELAPLDGAWRGTAEGGTIMLRINERWVERWWAP